MHLLFAVTRHGVGIKSNPGSCRVRLVEEGKIYLAGRLNTACIVLCGTRNYDIYNEFKGYCSFTYTIKSH